MTYRTFQQIFPPDYPLALTENDAKRLCAMILAETLEYQNIQHICRSISQTVDPYNREYLVTIMHTMILDNSMSDDYDAFRLTTYQLEQLESEERFVVTKARNEQWVNQTETATRTIEQQPTPELEKARVYSELAEKNFSYFGQVMQDLQQRVEYLEAQIAKPSTTTYIWPSYTETATEEDKKNFENSLRNICTSGAKSVSSDVKNFIISQSRRNIIIRPGNLNTELSYIKKFGYPYGIKAYYRA